MKSWHGFLGTLLLFLQLGNLCLRRRIALCCVPTPQHVLERRIGHSSPCREEGREGMREGGEQILRRGEGGERGRGGEMAEGEGGRERGR